MQTRSDRRIGWFMSILAFLTCSAALALDAPPAVRGDGNHDVRYPFASAPRSGHALVYDAARQRVVVYGGLAPGNRATADERAWPTMEWDGAYWKGVRTANFPTATTSLAMAYDAARGVTVLFGGRDAAGNMLDETWLYDGTNWTRATPVVSPPARAYHAMAFDAVSQRVLLYGGASAMSSITGTTMLRDFWAWDGVNWTQLGGVPADLPALYQHAMACDANRGVTVLYGGLRPGAVHTSTWEWNGTTWANRNLSGIGTQASMAYDSDGKRILAWVKDGAYRRLYAYDGTSWVQVNEQYLTGPQTGPIAYDEARHEVAVVPVAAQDHSWSPAACAAWFYGAGAWRTRGFYSSKGGPLLFSDFNGDGWSDLLMQGLLPNASGNGYSAGVALFLNGPSGFDHRPVSQAIMNTYSAGKQSSVTVAAASGDMNGDGLLDLALGCAQQNDSNQWVYDVRVLAGGPGGTFSSTASWSRAVPEQVAELTWTDVNGDGRADLAVLYGKTTSSPFSCVMVVHTSMGSTLTTTPASTLSISDMMPSGMAWADVNRDGAVDVAVAMKSSSSSVPDTVRVYTNGGSGSFTQAQALGGYAGMIRFADLNGDGWPDLVGPLFAYLNHAGSFGAEPEWKAKPLISNDHSIAVGDVDGDGDPDVAVFLMSNANNADTEAYVYRNDAGSLTELPVWSAARKPDAPTSGALGDADGDGVLDLATQRGIFLLDRFAHTPPLPLMSPMWFRARVNPADHTTALVEWDPVPGPDVAGYRLYGVRLVRTSNGWSDPSYGKTKALIADVPASQTQFVASSGLANSLVYVATIDKAGREYGLSGPVPVGGLKATNSAADSARDFWWWPYFSTTLMGLSPAPQFVTDLDGDGDQDVFSAILSPHPVEDNRRTRWLVYTNDGSGSFSQAWEWRQSENPADLYGPGRVEPMSLGDLNGDGLPDLVCAASRIVVNPATGLPETQWVLNGYMNTGTGFAADTNWTSLLPTGYAVVRDQVNKANVTWGDANGDGRQDLVVVGYNTANVGAAFLFLNQGGRLADAPAWTSRETNVTCVDFGALDNDGKADLAVSTADMGAVVYKGVAQGLAAARAWSNTQSVTGKPVALTWADFNGDGKLDLTVHGESKTGLYNYPTVLYRNTGGTLEYLCVYKSRDYLDGAGKGIGVGASFTRGWADMDHDGDLDLWGADLILEADTPTFNAGPIGSQPDHWHGNADEEGLGYKPPWSGVVGVSDVNGDGTPDHLYTGSLTLRTPSSIYQADYVKFDFSAPVPYPYASIKVYPAGESVLDGPGDTQAFQIMGVKADGTEVPFPYDPDWLSISLLDNPDIGKPYATLNALNPAEYTITAVREGRVRLEVMYGPFGYAGYTGSTGFQTLRRDVRVINAQGWPDVLEITPSRLTLTRLGETAPLTVTRQHTDGWIEDVTARSVFQSSNPAVVTLDGQVAIARGNDVATVTATFNGRTATSQVTVAASATLTGLTLSPPEASVRVGETCGLEVRAQFSDGTVQPVTFLSAFASAAPDIASVEGFRVLGVSPGIVAVTATYLDQSATADVNVLAAENYAVSYAANEATSGVAPSAQTKTHGETLTLAGNTGNLTRTGFNFAGWNTAADGTGANYAEGANYIANAAVTLYAKWTTLTTYPVTYHANGATSGSAPVAQTKTHGVALTLATNSGNLARIGYTFAGWDTAPDGTGTDYPDGASYTMDAAVTLYAAWTAMANGPGDLNGDQVVNINDLTLVTANFGKTSASVGWNPLADANGDGVVNINDLTLVTANFGRTYP